MYNFTKDELKRMDERGIREILVPIHAREQVAELEAQYRYLRPLPNTGGSGGIGESSSSGRQGGRSSSSSTGGGGLNGIDSGVSDTGDVSNDNYNSSVSMSGRARSPRIEPRHVHVSHQMTHVTQNNNYDNLTSSSASSHYNNNNPTTSSSNNNNNNNINSSSNPSSQPYSHTNSNPLSNHSNHPVPLISLPSSNLSPLPNNLPDLDSLNSLGFTGTMNLPNLNNQYTTSGSSNNLTNNLTHHNLAHNLTGSGNGDVSSLNNINNNSNGLNKLSNSDYLNNLTNVNGMSDINGGQNLTMAQQTFGNLATNNPVPPGLTQVDYVDYNNFLGNSLNNMYGNVTLNQATRDAYDKVSF